MTNPRLAGPPTLVSDATWPPVHQLRIVWDSATVLGAELPRAYFEAVEEFAPSGSGSALFLDVALTADREITVSVSYLFESLRQGSGTVSFTLAFPDRRDFLGCRHPGMPDRYLLEVTLRLSGSGEVEASFRQTVSLGAI